MRIFNLKKQETREQNTTSGFTLVEVLVAFAITSVSLVMVLQLFSIGLRSSVSSCNYTTAIVHARDKMEEMHIEPVQGSGTFEDGFEWESEVLPFEGLNNAPENDDYNLMNLKVKIIWLESNKKKSFEMETLKTVSVEDE
jgi:general secretion pathway protein I